MNKPILMMFSLALALCTGAAALDPFIGTWKFDPARSKSTGNQSQSEIYTVTPAGSDGVTLTKDYVTSKGASHHATGTCKFDGKYYPVAGHSLPDATRAVKRIDSNTWETVLKSAGTIVQEQREVVSKDGNTLTVTGTVTYQGQTHEYTMIYSRQ